MAAREAGIRRSRSDSSGSPGPRGPGRVPPHWATPGSMRSRDFRETSCRPSKPRADCTGGGRRSEEHTSELQSRENLVCRLLLEKKNTTTGKPKHEKVA